MTSSTTSPPAARDCHQARPTWTAERAPRDPVRAATAFAVIAAAGELGLLANGLLRVQWGVNIGLWATALAAIVLWLAHTRRRPLGDEPLALAAAAVIFAAGLAVRDTEMLAVLNVGAMLTAFALLGMVVVAGPASSMAGARVRDYFYATARAGWNAATGAFPLLLRDASVNSLAGSPGSRQALAVLRGALIATPLLILFGGLFMAADAAFNDLVVGIIGFDFDRVASHVAVIGIVAWLSAGYLHGMLLEAPPRPLQPVHDVSIGATETGAALTLLNLLFGVFVAMQARYLFGGAAIIRQTAGLSYAEYARRGFFELTLVTALVVPVLLLADLLMRRERPAHQRMFRWLAGALVLLVGLVMVSAAHRMRLYQAVYGLTESRLYASAFMVWIAVVLAWFAWTVLRGQGQRFAAGAVLAGWGMLAALNLANPDRLIARVNLERARAGAQFDLGYASRLSADALPVVLEALRTLPAASITFSAGLAPTGEIENMDRCIVKDRLLRWSNPSATDWRSWNLGRSRARQAAASHSAAIAAIECVPVEPRRGRPAPAEGGQGPAAAGQGTG